MTETQISPAERLMTVGQLSRRTGLSAKSIRDLEQRGLIYSAGRSRANYRLYDDTALWCVGVVQTLRGLGLTIRQIEGLGVFRETNPDEPIGRQVARVLDDAERRIGERVAELDAVRSRIATFRAEHAASLAGGSDDDLVGSDPRVRQRG